MPAAPIGTWKGPLKYTDPRRDPDPDPAVVSREGPLKYTCNVGLVEERLLVSR